MSTNLHCPSCGRGEGLGPNDVETVSYLDQKWCVSCAAVRYTDRSAYIVQPSPGLMVEGSTDDPLVAWEDCYSKAPKKRILKLKAKAEIQRAWSMWDGDKSHNMSKITFYAWLTKFRPYFLTFRGYGDPWQTVHCWLRQYERKAERR